MGKNNKFKRTFKKRKKEKALKVKWQEKGKSAKSFSPVMTTMENPLSALTEEQRKKVMDEIGESNKRTYQESLEKIWQILEKYDSVMLISIMACYGLTTGAGDKGVENKEKYGGLNQSHVELLQALFLQIEINKNGREPVTPDIVQEVWDALTDLSRAFFFSRMNSSLLQATEEEKSIQEIQELIRGHSQSVRNWGYFSQVKTISKELYSYFDPMLTQAIGVSATDIINIFLYMIDSFEDSLTERWNVLKQLKRIKNSKELVFKYYELTGQDANEADIFINEFNIGRQSCKNVFFMLLSHYDLRLEESYLFNVKQISYALSIDSQSIKIILDEFSFSPGELSNYNSDYIFLDNPVWNKPIVKLDNEIYFCAIPQLFFSFIFPLLDGVVKKVNKKLLHQRRADYLEEKIEEIVKRRFPEALTVSGVKWVLNDVQYETDLITFIDSHAIIFEAKSHNITKSALRGAPDRIKRHFKEIFIEPSIQSKRLEEYLIRLRESPDIECELRDQFPVDLSSIHQVLRVSISLEDFATVQANISRFNDTGWVPEIFSPCPTMNLADFETLFNLLEHPVQIIHYLKRRTEMEGKINFLGYELDFMGFYMSTLFNMGNIYDMNLSQFVISEMSSPIDNYYMSMDEGIFIKKPQPKISKLFRKIFDQLEKRNTFQWTEIGVILNMFSPDDQLKLESYINKCKKNVNRNWYVEGHKNAVILAPPSSSEYALAYLLYKDGNANRRNEFIENAICLALEPGHVHNCLVIAKNIDHDDLPYHYIALVKDREIYNNAN